MTAGDPSCPFHGMLPCRCRELFPDEVRSAEDKIASDDLTKVTVNIPTAALEALRGLARVRRTTVTNVLRQAINTELVVDEQMRSGGKILIAKRGQITSEIVRR